MPAEMMTNLAHDDGRRGPERGFATRPPRTDRDVRSKSAAGRARREFGGLLVLWRRAQPPVRAARQAAQIEMRPLMVRVHRQRLLVLLHRVVGLALFIEGVRHVEVRADVFWVQSDGLPEIVDRLLELAHLAQYHAQVEVCPGLAGSSFTASRSSAIPCSGSPFRNSTAPMLRCASACRGLSRSASSNWARRCQKSPS